MTPERSDDFEPSLEAPFLARRSVQDFLSLWQAIDNVDDATLLTSELVTNAVRHATARVALHLQLEQGLLRVEVTDGAPTRPPTVRRPSAGQPDVGGYGLRLVDELATRWGYHTDGERKIVWFELGTAANRQDAV